MINPANTYGRLSTANPNRLGAATNDSTFGYLGPVLTAMANTRRWTVASDPSNAVVIDQTSPLQLVNQTPIELLSAVRIAAQGSAVKSVQASLMPAAGADLTLDLGTVKSFGVRVRLSDSPLSFKFGALKIELLDGSTSLGIAYLIANRLPAEVFILGISNAGGQASATTIANPKVKIYGSAGGYATTSSSTTVWAETLNLRDVGVIQG